MRKTFILSVALLLIATAIQAQMPKEWEGRWWESFIEEASLPINLSIKHYIPLFYSPTQTSTGVTPSQWSFNNDTLRWQSQPLRAKLTLVYHAEDSTFRGTFTQGMLKSNLLFRPCDTILTFPRPQHPNPPYSFTEKEIRIEYDDSHKRPVTITGSLAVPTTPMPQGGYPAVVLVSGSGQQDRNSEVFCHKPFLVWAEYLAQHGIASLRYDDRGIGGSGGELTTATTFDFAEDAEQVFNFLRRQKDINARKTGIMGHSEGGVIAPIVASHNKKVGFVVLLAGPGSSGKDVLLQQNDAILRLSGIEDENLLRTRLICLDSIYSLDTVTLARIIGIVERNTANLNAEQIDTIGLNRKSLFPLTTQLAQPWFQTFIKLNPKEILNKVRCPILAINGGKDCQVLAGPNLEAIHKATTHNPHVEIVHFPDLNHMMQHCETGRHTEYVHIQETIAPEVLERVTQFILSL